MSARAELSSVSTSLDELVSRITRIAESLAGDERDVVGPDLFEVERALRGARRRLNRIVDSTKADRSPGLARGAAHRERPRGACDDGQKSARTHSPQRGRRAMHTRRPCRIRRRLNAPHWAAGSRRQTSVSMRTGSVASVRPSSRVSRVTWVSTGRPGRPKPTLRTTLAVLRPTPGT
jgi:hypothetical protein